MAATMSRRTVPELTRNYETELVNDHNTAEFTRNYYVSWAKQYNHDTHVSDYNGPRCLCDAFYKLTDVEKDAKILDVVAGTGQVGKILKDAGYTNVDAHDGCQEMLDIAREKNLYQNYICCLLGEDHKSPVSDGTYGVLLMSGGFAPGHLYSDVFPELLRITRTGGYICWAMRGQNNEYSTKFLDFDEKVEELVTSGHWKFQFPRERIRNYVLGYDGFVYVMKKLKE